MFRDSLGMPIDAEESGLQTTQILTKDNVGDITGNWSEPQGRARPVQEALGPLLGTGDQ